MRGQRCLGKKTYPKTYSVKETPDDFDECDSHDDRKAKAELSTLGSKDYYVSWWHRRRWACIWDALRYNVFDERGDRRLRDFLEEKDAKGKWTGYYKTRDWASWMYDDN